MSDLPSSITSLHRDLKGKKYDCVSLVDKYLARISEFDKDINAFITVTDDYAYKKARECDDIIRDNPKAFDEFPLLGVVIALKDIFSTKDIRTTAASKVLEGYVPSYNATSVEKLEKAGAIVIGKANLDAWAHGSSGENSDFGSTKNPWNKSYVPGGSSSGSAAAVAGGFCLAATSTDTCGSTRLPANFCGLYGLKPTYGAVSRYGVIAMASSLDTVGHIAKNVNDLRTIFDVMKGEDGFDSTVKDDKFKSKKVAKIGIPKEFFEEGLDRELEKNILEASKVFKNDGIELVDISLPSTKYAVSVYYIIQPAEVSSNLGRYDGVRFGENRDKFGPEAKRRIMLGTHVLSSGYYDQYYGNAMKVRSKIINEISVAFDKVDAILAPVSPTSAFKLGEKTSDPLKMYLTDIYAATANLSGIPSIAVPSGFTKNGLPLGFQLMGPRFSEHSLFDLAEKYQSASGFEVKLPEL